MPIAAAIVAALFVSYFPALRAGFIWDDSAHLTPRALRSVQGLWRIWAEPGATQQFYPLLHTLFWVEHQLWGDAAVGYHVTNVALHGLAAYLLVLVLRRLAVPGAMLAALVFALHPVHVESVAWISEQKNTLSAVFYLGAALVYLRFDTERRWGLYAWASGLFLLGVLTKTVIATLPAALLVALWWSRGRLAWRRDVIPLLSWFIVGAAAGLFTVWVERKLIGAEGAAFELSLAQRCVLAGRVVWFYLGKLLWPANLTFVYPRWTPDAAELASWLPLAAALAVLFFAWRSRHSSRAPLAAMLLFGGSLFPALGFFNVYPFRYSFVADHFQYIASIAMIAFGVAVVARMHGRLSPVAQRAGRVAGVAALAALGMTTWGQTRMYHDAPTLFRVTIARNPACWMAHNNLGELLMSDAAQRPVAITHFERALQLHPNYFEARNNLGLVLAQTGRAPEAILHLEEALRLKPVAYQAHNNLGIALASSGRATESLASFQRAAELNSRVPNIHENWARALIVLGRQAEADERFAEARRLRESARASP